MQRNRNKRQPPTDKVSKNWQVGKNLGACIQVMYGSKLWTDVKFRCKDHGVGERIHAHKVILAARSPVFQELFYGSRAENKDELELSDIEKEVFEIFLRYVYTDTVTLEEGSVLAVLQVANRYQVSGLAKFCEDYLSTIITTENACKILGIALCHNLTSLRDACCSYIDQNACDILNSEGFMELSKDALLHVLKGDTFYAQEDAIFLKAEEWAIKRIEERGLERNGAAIKQTLGKSFYYLRLPAMTYKMLMTCTRNKGYFSADEYIDLADFINGVQENRILTNSCVARVPETEKLLPKIRINETEITGNIRCSFQVSVSKDTELIGFGLVGIEPYLEYKPGHYVNERYGSYMPIILSSTSDCLQNYYGRVIAVQGVRGQVQIKELDEKLGHDLGHNVSLKMEWCFYCQDLDLDQKFEFDSSTNRREIYLKPPVILRKTDKPYNFSIDIRSIPYNWDLKMKIHRSESWDDVTSKTGHVKILTRYLQGIQSITIRNFANRDAES